MLAFVYECWSWESVIHNGFATPFALGASNKLHISSWFPRDEVCQYPSCNGCHRKANAGGYKQAAFVGADEHRGANAYGYTPKEGSEVCNDAVRLFFHFFSILKSGIFNMRAI